MTEQEKRAARRVKTLRQKRGLTLKETIEKMQPPSAVPVLWRIEAEERPLTDDMARRLAPVLGVWAEAISPHAPGPAVPLRYRVASAFAEAPGAELPEPWRPIYLPSNGDDGLEDGFAVQVADDSADELYPAGSVLICRRVEPGERLAPGEHVVARVFVGDLAGGDVMEILVGELDRTLGGDLLLSLRTSNRELPSTVTIRRRPAKGLNDAHYAWRGEATDQSVAYTPLPEDRAEIIGVVEFTMTRRRRR